RVDRHGGADAGAGQFRFHLHRIRDRLHRRGVPQEHDVDERVDAADPIEFGGLEAHALGAELLVERRGRRADADYRAVLRRDAVDVGERQEGAGARPVLRHDAGIAGDVLAEMAGEEARVEVVAAGRRIADGELDLLAFVEWLLRRGRFAYARDGDGRDSTGQKSHWEFHWAFPVIPSFLLS